MTEFCRWASPSFSTKKLLQMLTFGQHGSLEDDCPGRGWIGEDVIRLQCSVTREGRPDAGKASMLRGDVM